jgi:hypothetical protein
MHPGSLPGTGFQKYGYLAPCQFRKGWTGASMATTKTTIVILTAAAVLFLGGVAEATVHNFNATMDGSQANAGAGTGSPGTGSATVTFDDVTNMFSWNANWIGLIGVPTAAHFHGPALPNQNAGVQVGISAISPSIGSGIISPIQAADLFAGLWYLNIHTTSFPGGEIRGQATTTTTTGIPLLLGQRLLTYACMTMGMSSFSSTKSMMPAIFVRGSRAGRAMR